MQVIPKELEKFFAERHADHVEVVEHNARKGRYCIRFHMGEGTFFLKYNEKGGEYQPYFELLEKERQTYRMMDGLDVTPRIMDSPYFVMENSDGGTLRHAWKARKTEADTREAMELTKSALLKWQRMILALSEAVMQDIDHKEAIWQWNKYWSSLLCSGPFDTHANKVIFYRNLLILKVKRFFLGKKVAALLQKCQSGENYVIHGDFHLNNILIKTKEPYLIDFENIKYCSPTVELAYFWAQQGLLCGKEQELKKELKDFMEENITIIQDWDVFWKVCHFYENSIRWNRRFL